MSDAAARVHGCAEGAPAPLLERALGYVARMPAHGGTPELLAAAGAMALERAVAHPGDRSIALDLLASDALVTLALETQADQDPSSLARFASGLRRLAFREAPPTP